MAEPGGAPPGATRRFHDLDALRAFAMLLGIAYHAAAGSQAGAPPGSMRYDGLDAFTTLSHSFRMPLFFLIAGFFAAMVAGRQPVGSFLRGRSKRIGVPLAVGIVTLVPLTDLALDWAAGTRYEADLHLRHLWFLEFLLIFYVLAVVLRRLLRGVPGLARTWAAGLLHPLVRIPLGVGVATAALVLAGGWDRTPEHVELLPTPGMLAYYGTFFASGWLLWPRREDIHALGRWGALFAVVWVALGVLYVGVERDAERAWAVGGSSWDARQVGYYALGALLAWSAIYALVRLASILFDSERPAVRYVVDGSYWVYLVHMPVHVWLLVLLDRWGASWAVALAVTIVLTTAIGFATYSAFVRHTAIGTLLHGPRPRAA